MRRQISSHVHKKYKPAQSYWQRFLGWRTHRRNKKLQSHHQINSANSYKGNPFKKDNKPRRKISPLIKIIILLVVIVGWIVLLLYFPFFNINRVQVNGLENVKYDEVKTLVDKYLYRCKHFSCNNYFLVRTELIYRNLSKEFAIKDLEVKKVFPSSIIINLTEQKTSLIYDNGKAYYLVDNSGNIIKLLRNFNDVDFVSRQVVTTTISTSTDEVEQVTTTIKIHIPNNESVKNDYGTFPLLYDKRFKQVNIGQLTIPEKMVSYLVNFEHDFNKIKKGEIKYFILDYMDEGVKAITTNSWDLVLDWQDNNSIQLKNLQTILEDNNPIEYIDLREGSRVYWK